MTGDVEILGKGMMMGLGMIGPAIGIGLVGNAFINAVGRNPEAAKFLGQALVIIGIIELLALLVFASLFII
ncbi:F0F1 ATP synthase subunit C [Candidatus Saccharibacteria bacterium]|nr:F0F1 ATP synthase subunit C [Candidatus Saccharibacteria bacterium]